MRDKRFRIGALTALGVPVALAIALVGMGPETSDRGAVAAAPETYGRTAVEAAPAYDKALSRPQTASERTVGLLTPASDTRLVESDGPDDLYVGRIDGQEVLCVSIEQRSTKLLTTTCGGKSAIAAGQLLLVRSGDASNGLVVVGVAPFDSATVTVETRGEDLTMPVKGGLFVARPDTRPLSLRFVDGAGRPIVSVPTPGSPN